MKRVLDFVDKKIGLAVLKELLYLSAKYSVIFILIISSFSHLVSLVFDIQHHNSFFTVYILDQLIRSIMFLIYVFLFHKKEMSVNKIKTSLIVILIVSVSFVLNTDFPFFIFFLILLHRKYLVNGGFELEKIVLITIFFILISYVVYYLDTFVFYHLNELINSPTQRKGFGSMINFSTISSPWFAPITHLISYPYFFIKKAILELNTSLLIKTIINTKLLLSVVVIYLESLYYFFKKSGKKGYQALIPIKNNIVLLQITKNELWLIVPFFIPILHFFPRYFIANAISEKYNKSNEFAIGLTFLPWIFYPLLASSMND